MNILLFFPFPFTTAHSWVEQLRRLDLNGTMVGDVGFIRGDISRSDPAFTDGRLQYLLPPSGRDATQGILPSDPICRDTQQTAGSFNPSLPPLQARPGEYIALQYQEDGHVSLPEATPHKANSGTVFIYGTSSPSEDDRLLSIHHVWNTDGTGGDRRGVLLASGPFDDGQCYQINGGSISKERQRTYAKTPVDPQGADLWCQNDLRLPKGIHDNYTIYWVWEWPTAPTDTLPQGRMEIYTSCMDIIILPDVEAGVVSYTKGQDLNFAGIEGQMLIG
ncbi:hypothetical protein GGR52DRAFT_579936 [Hypoxylon sp. FL1284]|nr:hypothetical protein GGR52DRAFT_579936 [Hypoxylon sp. FL1284]